MKKKKGFVLRNICGENVIVAEGMNNIDFSNIVSMNVSAAYLWGSLGDEEFSVDDVAELLLREYEVNPEAARKDAREIVDKWIEAGIVEP